MDTVINNNSPLVSVYINTRNRANIIGRSITSLFNQTFTDFEVLILDAGSTDNTEDVIRGFSEQDNRIIYLKYENRRIANCMNYAIKHARGKYITQLDDDDEYLPTKIEKQVLLLENSSEKVGVVYCWEEFWDDKKNIKLYDNKPLVKGDAYLPLLEKSCVGGGTTMMIRKKAFDFVGGYDESVLGGDYQLNIDLAKYYYHDFVPEILVRTHVNHNYDRLSDMRLPNLTYSDMILSVEKILSDHFETFNNYPELRFNHYRSIMHSAAKINKFNIFFKYLILGLKVENSLKDKAIYILKGFKHLVFYYF